MELPDRLERLTAFLRALPPDVRGDPWLRHEWHIDGTLWLGWHHPGDPVRSVELANIDTRSIDWQLASGDTIIEDGTTPFDGVTAPPEIVAVIRRVLDGAG